MSFFASRNPSPTNSALTSPRAFKDDCKISSVASPKFSPLGSPKYSSSEKISKFSLSSPKNKSSRSRSSTFSHVDNIKDYDTYIFIILKSYKDVVGSDGDDIVETFLFFKDKVPLIDVERPNKLNKFLENYLIIIKKLTILATKKKFNLVQLL
jgi:hypothetical protein